MHTNSPTLLLLEDDAVLRKQLGRFLARRGFEVHCQESLRDFAEITRRRRFDLVIVDVSLSDGDGVEAWSSARPYQPGARVVAITACDSPELRIRAQRAGIATVLSKPIAAEPLLSALTGTDSSASSPDVRIAA